MSWNRTENERLGIAIHNYEGKGLHKLSLMFGDVVILYEECQGWYRGALYYDQNKKGIFPASYVHIKAHIIRPQKPIDEVLIKGDPLCIEAGELLWEWRKHWHSQYKEGMSTNFSTVRKLMDDVVDIRISLLAKRIASDNLQNLKTKLTTAIDVVNNKLGLPMIPRKETRDEINPDRCPTVDLFNIHRTTQEELDKYVDETNRLWERRTSLIPPQGRGQSNPTHHLYMSIEGINHNFPEDCEVFFMLYEKESKVQYLTERFCHRVPKTAENASFVQPKKNKAALFTDLGTRDLFLKMPCLVCHVVRSGRMLFGDKKNHSHHLFKRPYACGVIDLSSVLKPFGQNEAQDEERPAEEFVMCMNVIAKDGGDFGTTQDSIIKKLSNKGATLTSKGFTMSLTLQLFRGELDLLKNDFPKFNSAVLVPRLGFPEVILPGDVRNDFYIIFEKGEFDKGQKSAERNVEISLTVCNQDGKEVEKAIVPASGAEAVTEYTSVIFYHNNTPKWGETVKLNLPFEMIPKVHLRFSFRHLAKSENKDKADKTFVFAFMKIMNEDGSILQDGTHELCMYKTDSKKWRNAAQYLPLTSKKTDAVSLGHQTVSSSNITNASGQIQRSFRESFSLSTISCSTKLTQKVELLALLKWRSCPETLLVTLNGIEHVSGNEIFKFLQDTLDCLFQILTEHEGKYKKELFNVLIHILGFLKEGKFQHFHPVFDLYLSRHFSAALAYCSLLETLNSYIRNWTTEEDIDRLIKVFEVLEYLFKFISHSYALYRRGRSSEDETVKDSIKSFFVDVTQIMKAPRMEEKIYGKTQNLQSAILLNVTSILPDLGKMISSEDGDIAHMMATLLEGAQNIPQYHDTLTFIMNILQSPVKLLQKSSGRKALLPVLVRFWSEFVTQRAPRQEIGLNSDTTLLCIQTIGKMTVVLQSNDEHCSRQDYRNILRLLRPILSFCFATSKEKLPVTAYNWVNLLSVLYLCPVEDFKAFCDGQPTLTDLGDFLSDFFSFVQLAIRDQLYFKDEWMILHLVQSKVILKVVRCCADCLIDKFLTSNTYRHELFQECLELCVVFVTQKCLQLDKASLVRQRRTKHKFGDLRLDMGFVVIRLWGSLTNVHKEQFIISSIGDLIKMTLAKSPDLRRITLPLIWNTMQVDMATSGSIKRVEAGIIAELDSLFSSGFGDDEYRETFGNILTQHCKNESSSDIGKFGMDLVKYATKLMELVLDYRSIPDDDYNKDKRMGCMFNLLNFYKEIDKEEVYIKYIYRLSELHRTDERYTEAALTLLLHGSNLKWNDEMLEAVGKFPRHSARARKELLFKEAIQLLDLGKGWELGIPLCKALARLYEEDLFDYHKLGAILEQQASFYRRIISELRVDPEYFSVGYFGRGFPHFLRNKVFVHRGLPFEQLSAFRRRLSYEFPKAKFLQYTTSPEESVMNSPEMNLQVFKVIPLPDERAVFKGKEVEGKIVNYYNCNDINKFKYDRPFHKGGKDKEHEIASLWLERMTMETSSKFPGVLSYFPVLKVHKVEINPLDNAIESVDNKNKEILFLVTNCNENVSFNLSSLTMVLSGAIDAAVNGGTEEYRTVFLSADYLRTHPDHEAITKKLRKTLEDHCNILRKGLDAHRKRVTQAIEPLHQHMEAKYAEMRKTYFPQEIPKDPPRKMSAPQMRSMTMTNRGRDLPLPPVQIDAKDVTRTQTSKPKRVPSSRYGKGALINQSSLSRPLPAPPQIRPPPPPVEIPPLQGSSSNRILEAYEPVDLDVPPPPVKRRSITISVPGGEDIGISDDKSDDYEPVDFDPTEIKEAAKRSHHLDVTSNNVKSDTVSISSTSSGQVVMETSSNDGGSTDQDVPSSQSRSLPNEYFDALYPPEGQQSKLTQRQSSPRPAKPRQFSGVYEVEHFPPPPSKASPVATPTAAPTTAPTTTPIATPTKQSFNSPGSENVYGFDRLDSAPQPDENTYGFDRLEPGSVGPQPQPTPSSRPVKQDVVTPNNDVPPELPTKKRKTLKKHNTVSESATSDLSTVSSPVSTPATPTGPRPVARPRVGSASVQLNTSVQSLPPPQLPPRPGQTPTQPVAPIAADRRPSPVPESSSGTNGPPPPLPSRPPKATNGPMATEQQNLTASISPEKPPPPPRSSKMNALAAKFENMN